VQPREVEIVATRNFTSLRDLRGNRERGCGANCQEQRKRDNLDRRWFKHDPYVTISEPCNHDLCWKNHFSRIARTDQSMNKVAMINIEL
jgi:hypothetical protein